MSPFRLNFVLRRHKVSKRRLAKLTGIPYPSLCRLARRDANPKWRTVVILSRAIGCTLDEFFRKGATCRNAK